MAGINVQGGAMKHGVIITYARNGVATANYITRFFCSQKLIATDPKVGKQVGYMLAIVYKPSCCVF